MRAAVRAVLLAIGVLAVASCPGPTYRPLRVVPASEFRALALGATHSCVLRRTGAVFCWGANDHGQVGDGSSAPVRPTPTRVVGLDDAVALVAGENHSCALRRGGGVVCWGQHGIGVPAATIDLGEPAVELTACDDYTCARHASGTVSCWGDQALADAAGNALDPSQRPVQVPGLADAAALTCSGPIACAMRTVGDALCWGAVKFDDEPLATSAPVEPIPLPPFSPRLGTTARPGQPALCTNGKCWSFEVGGVDGSAATTNAAGVDLANSRAVALYDAHGCTVGADGALRCWSGDGRDLFGARTTGMHVTAIAVGDDHACALDRDRGLVCWGGNAVGQLGTGAWGDAVPVATRIPQVRGLSALSTAPNGNLTFAISGGAISWWGHGFCTSDTGATDRRWKTCSRTRPTPLAVPFRAVAAAAGAWDPCVVSDANELYCLQVDSASVLRWRSMNLADVREVSVGDDHACARNRSGDAWCWGKGKNGRLGDGTETDRDTPVAVQHLTQVEQITVGDAHSCARDGGGGVWCWGRGKHGRLGDGTWDDRLVATRVPGLSDAVDLAAADDTTCAVRASGQVVCWGRSLSGAADEPKPVEVPGVRDAVKVSVGCDHACAITSSGDLLCWGRNHLGQLGGGNLEATTGPLAVAGLAHVQKLAAGCGSTCAETTQGDVYCWGERARLGDGSTSRSLVPQPVADPASGW